MIETSRDKRIGGMTSITFARRRQMQIRFSNRYDAVVTGTARTVDLRVIDLGHNGKPNQTMTRFASVATIDVIARLAAHRHVQCRILSGMTGDTTAGVVDMYIGVEI